jgi:protein dithiol oxidoreductase (disulfide-forming)
MKLQAFGIAVTLALLAACGKQATAPQASAPPVITPAASQGAAPKAVAPKLSAAAVAEPTKIARTTEDGSEAIEDTTGDSGAHNSLLAAVAADAVAAPAPKTSQWQEGVNYTKLVPAQSTAVGADKVEVLEIFWYGCPHCFALEPYIGGWAKRKPSYVTFTRVPVMWNDVHRAHARLFYTLESLGKLDQADAAVWKEIQVSGNFLAANDPAESESKQLEFLGRFGVSQADFKKVYRSFAVETKLQRAEELTQRYRIDGVPKIIINGKFVADVGSAGGADKLVQLISDLTAQEHKH